MIIINIKNRQLFFKYAVPCAETLVHRGQKTQKFVDDLVEDISKNKEIESDCEENFKVAYAMCKLLAKRKNKKEIDDEIIREYYLFNHDEMVDKRFEQMGDFDPTECRIYSGQVIDISGNIASVKTILGTKKYRIDYNKDMKRGDFVTVHRKFVVEKISKELAEKLHELKENYFNTHPKYDVRKNE